MITLFWFDYIIFGYISNFCALNLYQKGKIHRLSFYLRVRTTASDVLKMNSEVQLLHKDITLRANKYSNFFVK